MRRTGRELTLFSIYGAPKPPPRGSGKERPKTPHRAASSKVKQTIAFNVQRQTQPTPSKEEETENQSSIPTVESIEESSHGTSIKELAGDGRVEDERHPPITGSSRYQTQDSLVKSDATKKLQVETISSPSHSTRDVTRPQPAHRSPLPSQHDAGRQRVQHTTPPVVMSLYGDGFIEMIRRDGMEVDVKVPFLLKMTLFRANDELQEMNRIASEATKHSSPELNDYGEFVRWSCCGSTDKSVFGCPVMASDNTTHLSADDYQKLLPPRLLASKQAGSDAVSFMIYDRGLPSNVVQQANSNAINAGCRISWKGYECWAVGYEIPANRWVQFTVSFDGHYLRVYVDNRLIDTAVARRAVAARPSQLRLTDAAGACSSIYFGGNRRQTAQVTEWRSRNGFIGLLADISIDTAHLSPIRVGEIKDISSGGVYDTIMHRNVFWREVFPPFFKASPHQGTTKVNLLCNFYHGAHNDVSHRSAKSFESLLVTVVQVGDVRVRIQQGDLASFDSHFGSDHGCRTQHEYEAKCREFVRAIERLSPLLSVVITSNKPDSSPGSFEVFLELCRSLGSGNVSILLHSMLATASFPREKDIKAKITEIITHEARRSPGEDIVDQAFRHFLSLAGHARDTRERALIESVMNRKVVITEKKLVAAFQRIGFYFAPTELQEIVRKFKTLQDNLSQHQHRADDIPTMSLLSPTATGMYKLPLVRDVSINATTTSEPTTTRSQWRFITVFLNYDLQLLDFIHEGCPQSPLGTALYTQSRYARGGFVDRLNVQLADLPSHVYCVLISMRHRHQESRSPQDSDCIHVHLENGETLQQMAQFDVETAESCKWLSLAAIYRSRKSMLWRFQALGSDIHATTVHGSLEDMNALLVDRHIVQVYDVIVSFNESDDVHAEFASRFAKNIRFGRNGKIVTRSRREQTQGEDPPSKLEVSLRIQGVANEIYVYRHDDASATTLPTIQSICRSILRTLADHGIKESLQQNPFVAGGGASAKKLKRAVTIRVTADDTNAPVASAYIFVEKSTDNPTAITNLASKIVPTLTMGSRLVSIRKRLQKRKYADEVKATARECVAEAIDVGMRYALVSLRDLKLMPIVRSRALLRRAMRRRRAQIVQSVLAKMSESEKSRLYSHSEPVRLQQLFRHELTFSPSEKEFVNGLSHMDLEAFRREIGLVPAVSENDGASLAHKHVEEVWQEERSASIIAVQPSQSSTRRSSTYKMKRPPQLPQETECDTSAGPKPKRSYQTDQNGVASCRLPPGSYSLYVFHTDYFEWTSLVVIFPTANASGLFGSSISSAVPQEIVVPVEAFKWSYGIQLVDFYQQHCPKPVSGVPIQVTDKLTGEQTTLRTQSDGTVVWDVRKGLYAIRAMTENTSIIYSGSKNVVVDGGRYHPPRTIFIPVLFGKVTIEVVVASFSEPASSQPVVISFLNIEDTKTTIEDEGEGNQSSAKACQCMLLNSASQFQLRPGQYTVEVEAEGYFPHSSILDAPWECSETVRKMAVVLCPRVQERDEWTRVVFSCVDTDGLMDAAILIDNGQIPTRSVWRHDHKQQSTRDTDAILDYSVVVEGCFIQAFSLSLCSGSSYSLRVACNRVPTRTELTAASPRIHVYNTSGLLLECSARSSDWDSHYCWQPCAWTTTGELVPSNASQPDSTPQ